MTVATAADFPDDDGDTFDDRPLSIHEDVPVDYTNCLDPTVGVDGDQEAPPA